MKGMKNLRLQFFWTNPYGIVILISFGLALLFQLFMTWMVWNNRGYAFSSLRLGRAQVIKAFQVEQWELDLLNWRAEGQKKFLAERSFATLEELERARAQGLFAKPTPVRLAVSGCSAGDSSRFELANGRAKVLALTLLMEKPGASLRSLSVTRCALGLSPSAVAVIGDSTEEKFEGRSLACSLLYAPVPGGPSWHCVTPRAWVALATGAIAEPIVQFGPQWEIIENCSVGMKLPAELEEYRFVGCERESRNGREGSSR